MRLLLLLPLMTISFIGSGQTTVIDSLQKLAAAEVKDEKVLKAYQALVHEYSHTNLARAKEYAYEGAGITKERSMWVLLSGFYTHLESYKMRCLPAFNLTPLLALDISE